MPKSSMDAAWAKVMPLLVPKETIERHRRVDLAITTDAKVDVSRAVNVLAPEAQPVYDAEQVNVDGVAYDSLQDFAEAQNALTTLIAGLGFITKGPETELSNEFALGSLATGLLKNTTTTGIPTIAVAGTDYLAPPLSATATLDFGSIAAQTCAGLDITVTGAVENDPVSVGPPAGIEASLMWGARVVSPDTVRIRLCNISASPIDPASADWTVTVFPA